MYDSSVLEIDFYRFIKTTNLAKRTQETYYNFLIRFYEFCIQQGVEFEKADPLVVRYWIDTHKHWANATQVLAAYAVRHFYRWKYGDSHPMNSLKPRKEESPPQRTLSKDELMHLLSSIDQNSALGVRNLALITLMVDTGLRSTEVCEIELEHINLKEQRINVHVKGGRWDVAAYFSYTAHCLHNWLSVRPYVAKPLSPYLFVTIGGMYPGNKLTRYSLRDILYSICRKAGVEPISPHVLRRTFATIATENGAPSRLVQVAGRWRDIRMVETYTKILKPDKLEPFSVVNRLMGIKESDNEK